MAESSPTLVRYHRRAKDTAPACDGAAVTPSDTVDLTIKPTRGLWVGGGGNVAVLMSALGTSLVFQNVGAGVLLPISVTRVLTTGTTATNILALY